jgi:thiol:disulfide interchange protein DsbD
MRLLLSGCICVVMFASACSRAPQEQTKLARAVEAPKHSRATLVLENSSLPPGAQTNVGIQFQTEKGWHIYWENPGDSGEPPRMHWLLPAGLTAGEFGWPAPTRLTTTAGTDYGYEGTVVLLSTLSVSPSAQPGNTMEVAGDLRWLVCHDICVPQRTELRAPLHIASTTVLNQEAYALLHAAAERIPKPLPAGFHASVTSSRDHLQLALVPREPVAQAEFFPSEAEQINDSAPQEMTDRAGIIRLTIRKSDDLQHDPARLRGVLLLNGRDSYQLDVPIRTSSLHQRR